MNLSAKSITLLFILLFSASAVVVAQDLKAEEILAKHLDSIGAKEKRAEIKNQFAGGISAFQSKQPNRKTAGKVVIVSNPNELFFLSSYNSQEYPFERIGFFKDKVNLPFVTSNTRSPLGAFLADHNEIVSEGVLAGSTSAKWFAFGAEARARIKNAGTKKIDGRKTYALDFLPKKTGSTDFFVKMYFDAETFQHIRTEYRRNVSARDQPFGTLGVQGGVRISLTENFGDFKTVNGLTLPHLYKISYVTDSNSGVYEYDWQFTISQYNFNQNLAADFFSFEKK